MPIVGTVGTLEVIAYSRREILIRDRRDSPAEIAGLDVSHLSELIGLLCQAKVACESLDDEVDAETAEEEVDGSQSADILFDLMRIADRDITSPVRPSEFKFIAEAVLGLAIASPLSEEKSRAIADARKRFAETKATIESIKNLAASEAF